MKSYEGEIELGFSSNKDFKRKIRNLNFQKELYENLLQIVSDGFLVLEGQNQIVFQNKGASVLLNTSDWSSKEGKIDLDSCPLIDILDETKNLDFLSYHRDIEVLNPEHRYLSLYCIPLSLGEDQHHFRVFLIKDVSKEKRSNRDNQPQPELIDGYSLGSGIAHELGNPIASLSLHAQLLERSWKIQEKQGVKDKQMSESIQVLKHELERLNLIIVQFLDAVRPSQPQFALQDMDDLINKVISTLKTTADQKRISFDFDGSEVQPFLMDGARLSQAFTNVILNAIEASPQGSNVAIRVLSKKNQCEIHIKDKGSGISPEQMIKIFQPYYTTKESGNGLGLLISYRIIQDHGGSLSVKSKPDYGTTFVFSLPIREKAVKEIGSR